MKLLVIRHAIAMDREEYHDLARRAARANGATLAQANDTDDDLRPLTIEGLQKMRKNAKGLQARVERPDLLVSSPLVRALKTAEILREVWVDLDVATCDELRPGSDPAAFCKWIKQQPQVDRDDALVAIVGHEPQLSSLCAWFLTGKPSAIFEFKKGGAGLLEFDSSLARGEGRLSWLATPSMLRAMR